MNPTKLRVKLFADGADKASMLKLYGNPHIQGFTTNPTLMRKAGISNYEEFARSVIEAIPDRPISFEVFADTEEEMRQQATKITAWGRQVYVKLPITNTLGSSTLGLAKRLSQDGVKLNITAILTLKQVEQVTEALGGLADAYVSVFAGRIADTGIDPVPIMTESVRLLKPHRNLELIWASPRQVLNVIEADAIGCDIITATGDILAKMDLFGKDLDQYSLETVRMFYEDGKKAGFSL